MPEYLFDVDTLRRLEASNFLTTLAGADHSTGVTVRPHEALPESYWPAQSLLRDTACAAFIDAYEGKVRDRHPPTHHVNGTTKDV